MKHYVCWFDGPGKPDSREHEAASPKAAERFMSFSSSEEAVVCVRRELTNKVHRFTVVKYTEYRAYPEGEDT